MAALGLVWLNESMVEDPGEDVGEGGGADQDGLSQPMAEMPAKEGMPQGPQPTARWAT